MRQGISDQDKINDFHIYFTLNAVHSYIVKYNSTNIVAVWDEKPEYERNVRKDLLKEYKGNRSGDSSPHQNNTVIKQFLNVMGIRSLFPRELEADDIVAFLCRELPGEKTIVSVDRDFIQLINTDIILFDPKSKIEFNINNIKEYTGYDNVEDWMTAKCLTGDKSDNVPGIPKFGAAKVKKYLEGSLVLTNEQLEVYNRNQNIFRLSEHNLSERETEYYKAQLVPDVKSDWKTFIDLCKHYSFNSILDKKETWYNTLFLSSRMLQIFG